MKAFGILISLVLLLTSCPNYDDGYWGLYTQYEPVLMKRSVLESSIGLAAARSLQTPGKMYFKNDTIFIVEKHTGIHVVDNQNPESPQIKAFITVPGIIDIAAKGNVLFADNAVDLVAIDMLSGQEIKRIKHFIPELTPPDADYIPHEYNRNNRPANTEIIAWKKVE